MVGIVVIGFVVCIIVVVVKFNVVVIIVVGIIVVVVVDVLIVFVLESVVGVIVWEIGVFWVSDVVVIDGNIEDVIVVMMVEVKNDVVDIVDLFF